MLSLTSLSDYGIDPYSLPVHPDVTTFDNPANHVVAAGTALDGVVELEIDGQNLCTGTLLPTRRHILTAAHCIDGAESVNAIFHLPGGNETFEVMADNLFVHPDFTGFPEEGADIGIIELDEEAPLGVASFDIRRTPFTTISVVDVVGYGVAGQGIEQFFDGNKRIGSNRYEAFFDDEQTMIMYDFDNGNAGNDAIGILTSGALANTGLGSLEVLGVSGDSGSPTFLNGQIVGVHSFRTTLEDGVGDAVPGDNGSFGEISVDMLVPEHSAFIDSIIIDQPGAPQITDILLSGSSWTGADPYSFTDLVFAGDQLPPIYTEDIDTIQVQFGEHVLLDGTEFALQQWGAVVPPLEFDNFSYDVNTHTAMWTFDDPLPANKYRIDLSTAIEDVGGNALDGEWENDTNGTPDNFADDPTGRTFLSGNGTAGVPGNVFQFAFSLLPGDRNQDGIVTTADQSVAGDVNGDGVSNGADTTLVGTYLDTYLPVRKNRGDYEDNETVSQADYMLWRLTFGSTTDLRADGNGDGIVDAADYTIWRDNQGATSAWYNAVVPGGGSFAPQVLVGEAPRVTNVTVSGSNSTHDPFSFDTVDGSGEQLRTVTVGGADSVSMTFSEDVNVEANFLRLTGMRTTNQPELAEFDYDIGTMTATWRFTDMFAADQYLISLNDAVTDIEGDALDGEWTNPASLATTNSAVSEFPSGDGNPGGAFNFAMTILPGDLVPNNWINTNDEALFNFLVDNPAYQTGAQFSHGDFNGDGAVDSADQVFLTQNYGSFWLDLQLLADLDGDRKVDQDDLDILYDNWDNGLPNPTPADGDLDGDGDIDVDDLDLAFAQFGMELAVVS